MHGGEESVGEEETQFSVQSGVGGVLSLPEGHRPAGHSGIYLCSYGTNCLIVPVHVSIVPLRYTYGAMTF